MQKRIAIVEDEPAIRENYAEAFRRHGYVVDTYADRASATGSFNDRLPDLVIIDIHLGEEVEGGFELCRKLRATSSELPIIFLTARDSELDAVSGLRLGADDYLTKDISLPHLVARVIALFRRVEALREPSGEQELLERGRLALDVNRLTAHWNGHELPLSLTEFWLVHALARFPGHVKSRQQLMAAANVVLDEDSVTSQIKRIRRKFQAADPQFEAIQTVYGMGYRWRAGDA